MSKASGFGLVVAGIIIAFLGLVLRLNLIDWLIDVTGFILIVVGIVVGIVGIFQMVAGKGSESSDY